MLQPLDLQTCRGKHHKTQDLIGDSSILREVVHAGRVPLKLCCHAHEPWPAFSTFQCILQASVWTGLRACKLYVHLQLLPL